MDNYYEFPEATMESLKGKTITAIEVNRQRDKFKFSCSDGSTYLMYHDQDCCENVSIEDIAGDLDDLIGSPILRAEEVTSSDNDEWPEDGEEPDYWSESHTWTFYKFSTIKGNVTIRWYGGSNGYYSESVSLIRTDIKEQDIH